MGSHVALFLARPGDIGIFPRCLLFSLSMTSQKLTRFPSFPHHFSFLPWGFLGGRCMISSSAGFVVSGCSNSG